MTAWLLRILIPLIGGSLRWRIEDPLGLLTDRTSPSTIIVFWHNRIFLMPYLFRKYWLSRERPRVAVLVSMSDDGEILARVLDRFNMTCIRGSTSRRGRQALRRLTALVREGYDTGITPDGPRGPKYRVQDGVISLARLTEAPIMPMSYSLDWKIVLKSWDAFMIPVPFSRAALRVGAPITVPRDADENLRENKRLELERTLMSLSEE